MAKARALDRRRRSVKNIRKITRTMELIATARFKKAMDRSVAARDYTSRLTKILHNIARSGAGIVHPLLDVRPTKRAAVLVLTGNRGLCGGYNSNTIRQSMGVLGQWRSEGVSSHVAVSGKRGISALKFRGINMAEHYTTFDDKPDFEAVQQIGAGYLAAYAAGEIDRLDVVYTQFHSIARQSAETETLLPLKPPEPVGELAQATRASQEYEFFPFAESILEEILPASFLSRLFKCFLDAAVSEQVARMVAMKAATENAGGLIKDLSRRYNRARQSQITGEIMEILGGVEALKS
ncbi:MAG: ATP synthase F1 subunit gamma [Planctomycetaceae bacterium]|jgi:F-type H+-transporting ATPase subunit gamma|nr:ATP synthase F1 subunit gamma [Planctomycetia bacterium]PHY02123.1 MAG: ATP synthase F1 subunit gamma [Planctomycetaceae bacterium]RLS68805.1 MAG: ATP synthase F1 subunit gamma [Planctomycetota bacterium]